MVEVKEETKAKAKPKAKEPEAPKAKEKELVDRASLPKEQDGWQKLEVEHLLDGEKVQYRSEMLQYMIPIGRSKVDIGVGGQKVEVPPIMIRFKEGRLELDPTNNPEDAARMKVLESFRKRGIDYSRIDNTEQKLEVRGQADQLKKIMGMSDEQLKAYFSGEELSENGISPFNPDRMQMTALFLNLNKSI